MKVWKVFFNLLLICYILFSVTGCSFSVGSPQRKPEISREDVKVMLREEVNSGQTKRLIENAVAKQQMEDLLKTPEAMKLLQQAVMESFVVPKVGKELQKNMSATLQTPEIQKLFQEHIQKALTTPEVQKSLRNVVQQSIMQIVEGQGGGGGGAGGGAGGT
ncbi:hypothetical protein [Thermincola ferriacetica]